MKAEIKKQGDTVIVEIDGVIDYETQDRVKESLSSIIRKTDETPKRIIFNFERLRFVGSSGIGQFVQVLKEFQKSSPVVPEYQNVRSEFQKIFKAMEPVTFDHLVEPPKVPRKKIPLDH